MSTHELDEIDRGILHFLQEDSRNLTPVDMAKNLPVSEGTVRNRIEQMEERGIIEGYVPTIDYEAAGFPLEVVFTCTVPVSQQSKIADDILEIHGIINVREMMAAEGNLQIVALATDLADVMDIAGEIVEKGVDIQSQRLTLDEHIQPFNHLGQEIAEE